MSTFDYRRNRRQQLVAKGEPVDNNISFDGKTKDFLNMFANKMKDTNNLYCPSSNFHMKVEPCLLYTSDAADE